MYIIKLKFRIEFQKCRITLPLVQRKPMLPKKHILTENPTKKQTRKRKNDFEIKISLYRPFALSFTRIFSAKYVCAFWGFGAIFFMTFQRSFEITWQRDNRFFKHMVFLVLCAAYAHFYENQ